MDETSPPSAPGTERPAWAAPASDERAWYLRPRVAIWLGPALIAVCLLARFGWGGIEGPPFPFWSLAYVAGAAGIILTYVGWVDRSRA